MLELRLRLVLFHRGDFLHLLHSGYLFVGPNRDRVHELPAGHCIADFGGDGFDDMQGVRAGHLFSGFGVSDVRGL